MIDAINHMADAWWAWLVPMLWQVVLVAAVVGGIDLALRKRGWPQVRYALWILVFVKLLLPPGLALPSSLSARMIGVGADQLSTVAPSEAGHAAGTSIETSLPVFTTSPAEVASGSAMMTEAPPSASATVKQAEPVSIVRSKLSFHAWLMMVNGIVTCGLFAWLALRMHKLWRTAHRDGQRHQVPESIRNALATAARRLRLRRLPKVVISDSVRSAGVFGVFRQVLVLPPAYRTFSTERLEHVLLHELAHIKRGDLFVNALQALLTMLYWFHPVLWFAGRQLRHLREVCCDATVSVLLRERTRDYCQTLVDAADRSSTVKSEAVLGLLGLFEAPGRLRQRLVHLQRPAWKHAWLRTATALGLAVLMFACILPMAVAEVAPSRLATPFPGGPANQAVVRGIVTEAGTGKLVAGVTVELLYMHADPPETLATADSGADGRFELISDQGGKVQMIAHGGGWFSDFNRLPFRDMELVLGGSVKDVKVPVKKAVRLKGRVVAKGSGKPILGASIVCRSFFHAESDADGRFEFSALPVDLNLRFSATAPGYGIEFFDISGAPGETSEQVVKLDRQAAFTGRVVDSEGNPVEDAEVLCVTGHRGSREYWTVKTDRKGEYRIQKVNRGVMYRVMASKQGYIGASEEVRVASDAGIVKVEFTFKSGLSAAGKVIDRNGKPVSGVTVHWGRGYDYRTMKTGSDGRFSFEGLKSEYRNEIYALKPGYAMGTVSVDPKDPKQANNVIVKLKPELTISGVVLDTKGKPVPNARLTIGTQVPTLQETQTDSRGRFTMRTLDDQSYKITVISRKLRTMQESEAIKAGTQNARIVLREFSRIQGQVVDDATGKPLRSFNVRLTRSRTGEHVPGISVSMIEQGLDFSDKSGKFQLPRESDPTHAYRLIVNAAGYEWGEADGVHSGKPVEIRLKKAKPVTVRVQNAETGKPVEDALVRFYYFHRADVSFDPSHMLARNLSNCTLKPIEAKSLGSGRYEIAGVGAGPWVLEVLAKGFSRYVQGFREGVKGGKAQVKLTPARSIRGVLKAPNGMRPDRFEIALDAGGNQSNAKPDQQGRFTLESVPPERGSISVGTTDHNSGVSWSFDPEELDGSELEIDLSKFFALEGRVVVDGEYAPNVRVNVFGRSGADFSSSWGQSAADGHYRVFMPRKGTYTVQAESATGRVKLDIEIAEPLTIRDLQLVTGSISGVLLDRLGAPLPFASVNTERLGESPRPYFYNRWREESYEPSENTGYGRTDRLGNFSIVGLTPGRYRVFGRTRERDQTYSDIIELNKDGENIENIRLSMVDVGGLDVQALDAATGKPVKDVRGRLRCIGIVTGVQRPDESVLKMVETLPGKYDLVVGAPGYQSVVLPAVEVKAKQRRTITVKLEPAGNLAVVLKVASSDGDISPTMFVVLKNVAKGKVAFRDALSNFSPNVGSFGLQPAEGQLKGVLDSGIAPGDYKATFYYMKMRMISDAPVGQFDVSFHVDAGKTTEIRLDEADIKPFADPGIASE